MRGGRGGSNQTGERHGLEMAMEMTSYEYVVHLLAIWYEPNANTTDHTSTTTSTCSVFLMCATASRIFTEAAPLWAQLFVPPLCIRQKTQEHGNRVTVALISRTGATAPYTTDLIQAAGILNIAGMMPIRNQKNSRNLHAEIPDKRHCTEPEMKSERICPLGASNSHAWRRHVVKIS